MSYRDELDAAQHKIEALERELKEVKAPSTALALHERHGLVPAGQETAIRWLGDTARLRGERIVDGVLSESAYAEMVQCITDVFDTAGRSSMVPGRLDWVSASSGSSNGAPAITISVTVANGQTTIRGEIRLAALAGAAFGGFGGGVGLGGVMVPAMLFWLNPIAGALGVASWLGGTYWGSRKIYKSSVRKREVKLEEVLNRLEAIAVRFATAGETDEQFQSRPSFD